MASSVLPPVQGSQISAENQAQWDQIQDMSIDDQATTFLKAFILEFGGNKFEAVLDNAQEFKKYVNEGLNVTRQDLDEQSAHRFLERRGETLTATALRSTLKEIDVDNNKRVSWIEYALFTWKKSVEVFFIELKTPKHSGGEALEKAIAAYRAVLKIRADREALMESLDKQSHAGGVKAMAAKNQLAQMKAEDQLALNKQEITAGAQKRKAEKGGVDPFVEEANRVAREKEEADKAAKDKAAAGRAAILARAGNFGATSPQSGSK